MSLPPKNKRTYVEFYLLDLKWFYGGRHTYYTWLGAGQLVGVTVPRSQTGGCTDTYLNGIGSSAGVKRRHMGLTTEAKGKVYPAESWHQKTNGQAWLSFDREGEFRFQARWIRTMVLLMFPTQQASSPLRTHGHHWFELWLQRGKEACGGPRVGKDLRGLPLNLKAMG